MQVLNMDFNAPPAENFEAIQIAYNQNPLNLGSMKLFTITTTAAVTNMELYHNLGFVPQDIIVTQITSGSVTWGWSSMTKDKLTFTTTAATTIRVLIGSM